MKVYIGVGATKAQELSFRVLRHSILKHNPDHEIIVESINDSPEFQKLSKRIEISYGTVFSMQRFLVPEIAKRKGADICMHFDSDMLCLRSLQPFFDLVLANRNKVLLPDPNLNFDQIQQTAVFGCVVNEWPIEFFKSNLNAFLEQKISYKELIKLSFSEDSIVPCSYIYNSREYVEDNTAILHLTDLYRQPWVNRFNCLEGVWLSELEATIADDESLVKIIEEGVNRGYYLPSFARFSGEKVSFSWLKDLCFLPPQFDAYAQIKFGQAYKISFLRWLIKPCVIVWVQSVAIIHAVTKHKKM